jgi:hypothetical protein
MIKIFSLLALLWVNYSYSCGSVTSIFSEERGRVDASAAGVPSAQGELPSGDWNIVSPAFQINWGMRGEDTYISVIDCPSPSKSKLILSTEITAKNRELFERMHKKHLEEAPDDMQNFNRLASGIDYISSLRETLPIDKNDGLLLDLMSGSPGLIWTGSCISLHSGIPTLPELYRSLGLESIPHTHAVKEAGLRRLAANIDAHDVQGILFDFLRGIFYSKKLPSPAHYSIRDILKLLAGSHYITSNLDHLEDSLGYTETVEFEANESSSEPSLVIKSSKELSAPQSLPESFIPSWVLMVGLRADDYGIAKWAVDKDIPIYYVNPNAPELSDLMCESETPRLLSVRWIQADAQEYLPNLLRRLCEKMQGSSAVLA